MDEEDEAEEGEITYDDDGITWDALVEEDGLASGDPS
jgi:hypothetical protein